MQAHFKMIHHASTPKTDMDAMVYVSSIQIVMVFVMRMKFLDVLIRELVTLALMQLNRIPRVSIQPA